jgi:hypothetical protein
MLVGRRMSRPELVGNVEMWEGRRGPAHGRPAACTEEGIRDSHHLRGDIWDAAAPRVVPVTIGPIRVRSGWGSDSGRRDSDN